MTLPLGRKRRVLGLTIIMLVSLCLLCACALDKLGEVFQPSSEQVQFTFEHHIRPPNVDSALPYVSEIQVKEFSMGQGVYIRFRTEKDFLGMVLGGVSEKHPYQTMSCGDFFNAYPSDVAGRIEWWKPHEVASPLCYQTDVRQFLLADQEGSIVYYYSFPDFLD